jgi:hypothetical protein
VEVGGALQHRDVAAFLEDDEPGIRDLLGEDPAECRREERIVGAPEHEHRGPDLRQDRRDVDAEQVGGNQPEA